MKDCKFTDFKEGDFLNFEKIYTYQDFDRFSTISGDKNALYHDNEYSKESEFNEPIVPLHLSISPFSRIAGMYMPGLPSLYLGHKVNALKPIFYNQKTNYSSKIISINKEDKILTIRVLISQENIIKVVGTLKVQSTKKEWIENEKSIEIKNEKDTSYALITGATGEIGKSIAIRLASMGYNLLLLSRGNEIKVKELTSIISKFKCNYQTINVDFEKELDIEKVKNQILKVGCNISTIVHCASSSYNSSLKELILTNYKFLKSIVNCSLNSFINRQHGRIIFISTIYIMNPIQGLEDYIAAKSMTTSYLTNLNKFYSNFNIISKSILPTITDTPFSSEVKDITKLIPEEVADKVIDLITNDDKESLILDIGKVLMGNYQFTPLLDKFPKYKEGDSNKPNNGNIPTKAFHDQKSQAIEKLDNLIRSVLNLQDDIELDNSEYGNTPGWDSMAQFQLVAEIEEAFDISFTSFQLENATKYKVLREIILNSIS